MPPSSRDHSADAGGDPALLERKRRLRVEVWNALQAAGAARFPRAHGRIPNFIGAEAAAERLRGTDEWRSAERMKANRDSPQRPVRERALADGITVYLAVPRLAAEEPFPVLRPHDLAVPPRAAASIRGATEHGVPVPLEALEPVDLVVLGCVAVDRSGARLGKGGGFADLEIALAAASGLIGRDTVLATTVHAVQVLEAGRIPETAHDVPVDLVVTPDKILRCPRRRRATGIRWEELPDEKVAAIPLLSRLRDGARQGGAEPPRG